MYIEITAFYFCINIILNKKKKYNANVIYMMCWIAEIILMYKNKNYVCIIIYCDKLLFSIVLFEVVHADFVYIQIYIQNRYI